MAVGLGAVFGIGSTLLTDGMRARRDGDQRWSETKRAVYVRFLVALTAAHGRMVVAAFSGLGEAERLRAVHDGFHADPQNAEALSVLRELAITAPGRVYQLARDVYTQLWLLRDLLAETSVEFRSAEYDAANNPYTELLDELQVEMRRDLQPSKAGRRLSLTWTRRAEAGEVDEHRRALFESEV